MRQPVLVGFALALGALIGLSLIAPTFQKKLRKPIDTPDFILENVVVTHLDHGVQSWQLKAKRATINKRDHSADLFDVQANFFRESTVVLTLNSPKGVLNLESNDAQLDKTAGTWKSTGGDLNLQMDTLIWQANGGHILGSGNVSAKGTQLTLKALTLKGDVAKGILTIDGAPSTVEVTL